MGGVLAHAKSSYIRLMFAEFLKRLTAPAPERLADDDARIALGALLVRLARADGDYDDEEKSKIAQILKARYGLGSADTLLAECETLEAEAPDTVRFTRAIKAAVAYEDRIGVIEDMWRIVLADGVRDAEENSLMRMVGPMLGVEDQDSHAARLRVDAQG